MLKEKIRTWKVCMMHFFPRVLLFLAEEFPDLAKVTMDLVTDDGFLLPWIYIIAHLQHPSDTNSCILLKKNCGYFFEPDFYQFHLLSFSSCTWRNSKLSLPIELCRATHDLQIFSVFPLFYSLQLMDLSLSIIPSMEDIP